MTMHSTDGPFTCKTCHEEFSTVDSFEEHNSRLHCAFCKKYFKKAHLLRVHMRSHSDERPFTCTVCGKSFKTNTHLKGHAKTHTGEKQFTCHICGSSFLMSSNLKNHLKIHAGIKPHVCDHCNKRFCRPSDLQQHKRTHSGEKLSRLLFNRDAMGRMVDSSPSFWVSLPSDRCPSSSTSKAVECNIMSVGKRIQKIPGCFIRQEGLAYAAAVDFQDIFIRSDKTTMLYASENCENDDVSFGYNSHKSRFA
ncbi:gastrula zinc finger protein XlCGF57.1-like isoform X1 [Gigantopelta aegis]|uniref:gastrula zinc finger protein XlCGF57.1-like isoform X1 n=1 Tax=Gigantopelta aegis TaxID=1735272 RepID=UPI001B888690|nr:gastrula zinc finger protein XlCGF57.1-like isoform X1 [Gigantopelta aegis]